MWTHFTRCFHQRHGPALLGPTTARVVLLHGNDVQGQPILPQLLGSESFATYLKQAAKRQAQATPCEVPVRDAVVRRQHARDLGQTKPQRSDQIKKDRSEYTTDAHSKWQ